MKNDSYDNFKSWYVEVLKSLYPRRNAGFVVLIVSLALLERYLREKSGVREDKLTNKFYEELRRVFPELPDKTTAQKFWHVYRNGLLHQVTVSLKTTSGEEMPIGYLSHDFTEAVSVDKEGRFRVHPVKFSERVISSIESDFATYEGGHSRNHPLPVVDAIDIAYLGTSSPAAWRDS